MVVSEYSGKVVFIGIDVHLRQYTVCCRIGGSVVKRATMPGDPENLVRFVWGQFLGARVCSAYEAGFSGFVLHRALVSAGIENLVVHAAAIEVSRKRTKTDKRDAQKIAEQLEGGRLKGIHIPTEAEERARLITRTRAQLIRNRTRVKNQIRMRLHYFGMLSPLEKRSLNPLLLSEVRARGMFKELDSVIRLQESVWAVLDEQIRICDREIRNSEGEELVRWYRTVPGFGRLIAASLARELGDMRQFEGEKKLFSFTGLTPSEFTTDESRHLGHITRQGSARLRHLLVQAAWRAIKIDSSLQRAFDRIAARAGKKRAIVAVARKLIGRARAVVRGKKDYMEQGERLAA